MTRAHTFCASAAIVLLVAGGEIRAQEQDVTAVPVTQAARAGSGSIRGAVVDERGMPLEGATVSAFGAQMAFAVSDRTGQFVMKALPPGAYLVRAHLSGFVAARRNLVKVSTGGRAVHMITLRRIGAAGGPEPIAARPVLAAGTGAVAPDLELPEESAVTTSATGDDHGETAWRLRRLKRSVLRESTERVVFTDASAMDPSFDAASIALLAKPIENSARLAANLFADFPLTGHFNFLTTSAFDSPQDLFAPGRQPRNVAFLSIGAPAGRNGDWSFEGAITQGDVASWILSGSFMRGGPATAHQYVVGMSYSTQRYDGGNPMALAAVTDGSRNVGAVYAHDDWNVSSHLTVSYGARYAWYDYLYSGGLVSPRVGVTVSPNGRTRIRAAVAQRQLAPGAEEFLPPPNTGLWLPPERTFAPVAQGRPFRPERTRTIELALEHDLPNSVVVALRRFAQQVDDQIVTLFGLRTVDSTQADLGHYYVANGGSARIDGWAVSLHHAASPNFRGSIEYTFAMSHWSPSPEAMLILPLSESALRDDEYFHDVTTSLETNIPETATRVFVLYKVNSAFTRAKHYRAQPGVNGRFDVQVNQELPFMRFTNTNWEVLLAVRNLFREASVDSSEYDELLVVRPPKRIIGGLTVRF